MRANPKLLLQFGGLTLAALAATAWLLDAWRMPVGSRGALFDDAELIPFERVGLVLGCVPRLPDGRPNLYLTRRIEAAARLFHAGKVEILLLSGNAHLDTGQGNEQDEVAAMRAGLLAHGVPETRLVLDGLGLRTLDSIARAKLIYGQERFTVVSQRFHNERACYLAKAFGLSVVGYNAQDPPRQPVDKMRFREPFARLAAVLDRRVFGTMPRHLGEPIAIGTAP